MGKYTDFENFKLFVKNTLDSNKVAYSIKTDDADNFSATIKLLYGPQRTLEINFKSYSTEKRIAILHVKVNQFSKNIRYSTEKNKYFILNDLGFSKELDSDSFYKLISELSEKSTFHIPDDYFIFDGKQPITTDYICPVCKYGKLVATPEKVKIEEYENFNKEL